MIRNFASRGANTASRTLHALARAATPSSRALAAAARPLAAIRAPLGASASLAAPGASLRTASPYAQHLVLRSFASSGELAIEVPSLGDSITSGTIQTMLVAPGEAVSADQDLLEIETDKITVPIRAPEAGVVNEFLVAEGDDVTVGQKVVIMTPGGEGAAPKAKEDAPKAAASEESAAAPSTPTGPDVTVEVPSLGDSITSGTVQALLVKVGDYVAVDSDVAEVETDKITVPIRAPESGIIKELLVSEGDDVTVGQQVFVMSPGGEAPKAKAADAPKADAPKAAAAAPKADAPKAAPAAPKADAPKATDAPKAAASSGIDRSETVVKMSRMRMRIAERLKESQNTNAQLTTFQEVDMQPLIDLRKDMQDEFVKAHGIKLGFMSAFVKASALALRENPIINAVIDGDSVVYRNYVDISVAVATPNGLVVPVVRNADTMSFAEIEKEIASLGQRAREGKLQLEDMAGGCFTISNGGVFGSLMGTPIINGGQSAILGMHGTVTKPVVDKNGQIVVGNTMVLALSYDHRLIDGKDSATFLKSIKMKIADPRRMLLDL